MSKTYTGDYLDRIAFPLGGIGAGMICLEGTGALSHFSIRNKPDVFNEPCVFSALCVKGKTNIARVLEGPVPRWKVFGNPSCGNGLGNRAYGLPRLSKASFSSRFPFAKVALEDDMMPLGVEITGWSPFTPGEADESSLPVAALEYRFTNRTDKPVEAIYSFNARNFMDARSGGARVLDAPGGFIMTEPGSEEKPWDQGAFCACVDSADAAVDCHWFRGAHFDSLTIAWNDIQEGNTVAKPPVVEGPASPGGSIYVPLQLAPGGQKTIRLMCSWYVPATDLACGRVVEDDSCSCGGEKRYRPWYAARFPDVGSVAAYWRENYDELRAKSARFSECFFETDLPEEVIEAVEANLTILKSPTVLRQTDGRLWCWEGCLDDTGCCHGSCTHVWNYAQALANLFPELERTLRRTEFNECQNEEGHQMFRATLPIRPAAHGFHAAADGQLGGIMKVYRDWRVSGDTQWLKQLWPKVKTSLKYCIETWDPDHEGVLREPHHNTYDIEFWGPDGMCTSIYLGALKAAVGMGSALDDDVSLYADLLKKGCEYMERQLFNGEYYQQHVQWTGLRASPGYAKSLAEGKHVSEEAQILENEGPKYQYGSGCLSDGVIGCWLAEVAGIKEFLDPKHVASHLSSVYNYSLLHDLSAHANPQRPGFAMGNEGGLLLCSWPRGGKPSLPFVYSDEVWTGIEYQVAAHLMMNGMVDEGLDIVRTARERYDGSKRNPFNEYECGHWYARAMSSYSMLQALTGVRYDAVAKVLHIRPRIKGDFRSFLSTAAGYATVGVRDGEVFVDVKSGDIQIERTDYVKC